MRWRWALAVSGAACAAAPGPHGQAEGPQARGLVRQAQGLQGLDALGHPRVFYDNFREGPDVLLKSCALKNCRTTIFNPSALLVSESLVLVAARAFHGFAERGEKAAERGTVVAWAPAFSSSVFGFYTVGEDGGMTFLHGTAALATNCSKKRGCRYTADRQADPRLFRSAKGDVVMVYGTWSQQSRAHKMAYARVSVHAGSSAVPPRARLEQRRADLGPRLLCSNLDDGAEHVDEKNWVPFSWKAQDYLVYSFTPLQIHAVDYQRNVCDRAEARAFRGVSLARFVAQAFERRVDHLLDKDFGYPAQWSTLRVLNFRRKLGPLQAAFRAGNATPMQLGLISARGGTPGARFSLDAPDDALLFVSHVSVSSDVVPFLQHRAHQERGSAACLKHAVLEKHDGQKVDLCDYFGTYPNFYLMQFVVVQAVRGGGPAAGEAFAATRVSSLFLPRRRAFHGAKVTFPAGLLEHGQGYVVTYGENDCLANAFFVNASEVRATLFEPSPQNADRVIDERTVELDRLVADAPLESARRLERALGRARLRAPKISDAAPTAEPLAVITLGHKQGTFWLLDAVREMVASTPVKLCGPPPSFVLNHRGLWRWHPSRGYVKKMRATWSGAPDAYAVCRAFSNEAATELALNFDLQAQDVLQLAEHVPRFRMVRTVRDPRDVIVSGYHHHLRCPRGEAWLFLAGLAYDALIVHPSTLAAVQSALPAGADVRRLSYCELLKALPKPVGLRAEIAVAAKHWLGALDSVRKLLDAAPGMQQSVLFVRYEDLWFDLEHSLATAATFLFPRNETVSRALRTAATKSTLLKWQVAKFARRQNTTDLIPWPMQPAQRDDPRAGHGKRRGRASDAGETSNMRRGFPGQWHSELSDDHVALLQGALPGLIGRFGYDTPEALRHEAGAVLKRPSTVRRAKSVLVRRRRKVPLPQ
mmetsp:Transcript_19741/g.67999  ORF Transcript_19741/g.67999 Transcript_19741/m.67999 type:complete len:929 (+) Transcript_19741:52-2838(+)